MSAFFFFNAARPCMYRRKMLYLIDIMDFVTFERFATFDYDNLENSLYAITATIYNDAIHTNLPLLFDGHG